MLKGPFADKQLFCYKPNKYTIAADSIRAKHPQWALELDQLANMPKMDWITSASLVPTVGPRIAAADAVGQYAQFVLYAIPARDLGSHSAGGEEDAAGYRALIDAFAIQVAGRRCVTLLEPDAVSMGDRMGASDLAVRYELLRYAAKKLRGYLDAGSNNWIPAPEMAKRLVLAGIADADGFALNTSGTQWSADEHAYGQAIIAELAKLGITGKGYLVDIGRNGLGPLDQWSMSPGDAYFLPPDHPDKDDQDWLNSELRGIGGNGGERRATSNVSQTTHPGCHGLVVAKGPGGSDGGDNRGNGEAGTFDLWEALALRERARPRFPPVV
jgi:glycosyl hydrolase family 6